MQSPPYRRIISQIQTNRSGVGVGSLIDSDSDSLLVATTPGDPDSDSAPLVLALARVLYFATFASPGRGVGATPLAFRN